MKSLKLVGTAIISTIFLFGCSQPLQVTIESSNGKANELSVAKESTTNSSKKSSNSSTKNKEEEPQSEKQTNSNSGIPLESLKSNVKEYFIVDKPITLGLPKADVIKIYGEPDETSTAENLDYAIKNLSVGLDSNGTVASIISSSPMILDYSPEEVSKVFGKPDPSLSDQAMGGRSSTGYQINNGEAILTFNWKTTGSDGYGEQKTTLVSITLTYGNN